ncbi:MAG: SLC13 family permease [Thermoplasmatota archaeon]
MEPSPVLDRRAYRKMAVGVLLALILFLLPTPEGLSDDAMNTLALFVLIIYFWATEALPLPVTALLAGVGLVVLRVVDHSNDAWEPYAKDTIFFLLGSLILADAVTKTDTDRILAARLLRRIGGSTDRLLWGIVVTSTVAAMIVSSHAIAAVMLPLVLSILRATGLHARRNIAAAFVLAIAFGTGIAGLATPSAGSRNAIVLGYLDELYGIRISYLEWVMHAMPITLVLMPAVFFILKWTFKMPSEAIDTTSIPIEHESLNGMQWRTLLVLAGTVVAWILFGEDYGLGTIAIAGAVSLFVLGILDWVDTRRRIAWGVPLIYGAALTMGNALQTTGAVSWLANALLGFEFLHTEAVLLFGTLALAAIVTNIMSDGGTAAVLAPVTLSLAALIGFPVADMGLITAMGAAFSFIMVIGTPPNVICYSSGLFTSRDLARAGIPLTVVCVVVAGLAAKFYWPLLPS